MVWWDTAIKYIDLLYSLLCLIAARGLLPSYVLCRNRDRAMTKRPLLFLGSAWETKDIATQIGEALKDQVEVRPWLGSFDPSEHSLDALVRLAAESDFALFVWGMSDTTDSRGRSSGAPRDNVVYEAGLFAGLLGLKRVFVVCAEETKIPSDFLGVTRVTFKTEHPYANRIWKWIYGRILGSTTETLELKPGDADRIAKQICSPIKRQGLKPARRLQGHWWQFVRTQDVGSVVSLFEVEPSADGRSVRLRDGKSWREPGLPKAKWYSIAAEFEFDEKGASTLHYNWEGEHPKDPQTPEYFGVGYIKGIDKIEGDQSRLEGRYTRTKRYMDSNEAEHTAIISTWYRRAEPEHVRVINGHDAEARNRLIEKMLKEQQS